MKKNRLIIFIILVLIIGILIVKNILDRKAYEDNNQEKIASYLNEDIQKEESLDEIIGILSIPIINLKRGFYSYASPLNDVNKNIQVIEDNMDSVLILAAHRGNSKVSFFENLEKLSMGDEIIVDYKHQIFKYRLYYKYYEEKDGNLSIKYDNSKDTLVLITCLKELKNKQVIYIAYKI